MDKAKDVEFKVGRRSNDGIVRLSPYPPDLLQLSVSYKGERSASVVLTREQVQALRQALTEFENEMSTRNTVSETWDNRERRSEEPVLAPEGH
jgi:hypothetical protein